MGKLGDPLSGLAWVAHARALARASGRTVEAIRALSDVVESLRALGAAIQARGNRVNPPH